MARPIWRGAIAFGMVSIPVRLFTATESKDIAFRQLHRTDHARIRQLRWCAEEEREVPYEEIARGYEYARDHYVLLEEEDFESLPLPSKHTVALSAFVRAEEIDPVYYERAYYLEPEEVGAKPFALLRHALEEKGLTALAQIAIRNKEQLCALRPLDGRLMLETLYYPDEIRVRELEPLAGPAVSDAEMQMAFTLIEMLEQPFDAARYRDEYRDALMQVIEAKLAGQQVVVAEELQTAKIVDLMAALKASVEATRARRAAPDAADTADAEAPAAEEGKPRRRRRSAAG